MNKSTSSVPELSATNTTAASSRLLTDVLCKVCSDHSSGKHYGIYACDGCAGFFKRSIRRGRQYECKSRGCSGECSVDKTHRNQCRSCRLTKCLQVGMNKEAVQHERGPRHSTIRRQLALCLKDGAGSDGGRQRHGSGPGGMTLSGGASMMTNSFVNAHAAATAHAVAAAAAAAAAAASGSPLFRNPSFYPGGVCSGMIGFGHTMMPTIGMLKMMSPHHVSPTTSSSSSSSSASSSFLYHPSGQSKYLQAEDLTMSYASAAAAAAAAAATASSSRVGGGSEAAVCELAARLLFMAVKWAKTVPAFVALPLSDQLVLLEEGWRELFLLNAAQFHLLGELTPLISAAAELDKSGASSSGDKLSSTMSNIRVLHDVIGKFKSIQVDATEYACLRGIVLFKTVLKGSLNGYHGRDYRRGSERTASASSTSSRPASNSSSPAVVTAVPRENPSTPRPYSSPSPPALALPSRTLRDPEAVSAVQDAAQLTLSRYVETAYPSQPYRFGKLLLLLPAMKAISSTTAVEDLFFRSTVGDIAMERLIADMYTSKDV